MPKKNRDTADHCHGLAELVADGELVRQAELTAMASPLGVPSRLNGTRLNGGLGLVPPCCIAAARPCNGVEDPERELLRLIRRSMRCTKRSMRCSNSMMERVAESISIFYEPIGCSRRIVVGWNGTRRGAQRTHWRGGGLQILNVPGRECKTQDPYIRERLMDLDDLGYRLSTSYGEQRYRCDYRRMALF